MGLGSSACHDEEEFEIERIIETRVGLGGREYLVKWLGYSDEDNTWEPADNLQNCLGKITEFNTQQRRLRTINRGLGR